MVNVRFWPEAGIAVKATEGPNLHRGPRQMLHSFHLLSAADYPPSDYLRWPRGTEGIELHDDLMTYMWDALSWAPCFYPQAGMRVADALDRCGPAVFRGNGALKLAEILEAYAQVFANGPRVLRLNCGVWFAADGPQTAKNAEINFHSFEREETVGKLRQIAIWARRASVADANEYVAFQGL